MAKLPCTCESCNSVFYIVYKEGDTEETPGFCTFCGEKLFLEDEFLFASVNDNEDFEFDESELDDESLDV